MKGARNIVKGLVVALNALTILVGLTFIGCCAAAYYNNNGDTYLEYELTATVRSEIANFHLWKYAFIGGMILGSCLVVLGLLGCCGAITEKKEWLIAFGLTMMLTLAVQVASGVLVFTRQDQVYDDLNMVLYNTVLQASNGTEECAMFQNMNQEEFCCGYNGTIAHCVDHCTVSEGCTDAIWNRFVYLSEVGGACSLAIIVIEIISSIFDMYIIGSSKSAKVHTERL